MTTSVYKYMIYRKLIEDKHVVKLRGTQMVYYKKQLFFCNCTVIKNSIVISHYIQITYKRTFWKKL